MQPPSKLSRAETLTVAGAYLAIILLIQGPFLFSSGMGYENMWLWMSEERGGWLGFVYPDDPMRPYLTIFYHVGYLLGKLPGLDGGFASLQIVYAAIWWVRALFVFVILRRALGGETLLPYLAGAITLVHAGDAGFGWIGFQPGFFFWMLFGIYFLVLTLQDVHKLRVWLWVAGSALSIYLALWTYESIVFILFLAPILLYLFAARRWLAPFLTASALWYAVIGLFLKASAARYLGGAHSYQQSILRKDLTGPAMLSDLWFDLKYCLSPWSWSSVTDTGFSRAEELALALACVAVFGAVARRLPRRTALARRDLLVTAAIGLALAIASFPAYVIIADARNLFRTQMLCGPGAAIFLASAILLIQNFAETRIRAGGVALILSALVVFTGSQRAMERSAYYRAKWEPHRRVMAEVLRVAPRVKPGSVVVLTNISHPIDPLVNGMWYDVALRLAYPHIPVGGAFFYNDGAPTIGNTYEADGDRWKNARDAWAPQLKDARIEDTVVIDFSGAHATMSPTMPRAACPTGCASSGYHPDARVLTGPPAREAIARYGPIPR